MTAIGFLRDLRSKNVRLWVEGERLRYSAPKGVVTVDILKELRDRKGEIIGFLRKVDETTADSKPTITRIDRTGELPLSFAQQRLWLLSQLEPESDAYNIPGALRFSGELDPQGVEACLSAIIRRHEVLRTVFPADGGVPTQLIRPFTHIHIPIIDLRSLPSSQRETEALRLADLEGKRPFDLATDLLLRSALIELSRTDHVLILVSHHIVTDAWSTGVLIREVRALYEAFLKGEPSPLPQLPVQYVDFAQWQKSWLYGQLLEEQTAYWKEQLEGLDGVLDMPTDKPRPSQPTFIGAERSFALPARLSEELRALCRQEGSTLFMLLLGAFQVLLYRYTGQSHILVGSPVANRNRLELEGLIGFFVNTLVLHGDMSGNPSFREFLSRIREMTLGAFTHQDLPFEHLVEVLQPTRSLNRSPLFEVMFVLENEVPQALHLPGLTLEIANTGTPAKFDLMLSFIDATPQLKGVVEYSTDLFEESTVTRMIQHLETLLEGLVADPEQQIDALPLLTNQERHQLLVEWNDTGSPLPGDETFMGRFDAVVENTPDRVAVRCDDSILTYATLNLRAEQFAGYLTHSGIGHECMVAIYLDRSIEMLVTILGAWKAGAAYLPLDPKYPAERVQYMLADAGARVLVTQSFLRGTESFPTIDTEACQVLSIDADWEEITRHNSSAPLATSADNLAYSIYTSGSTGKPKGALIHHRGMFNHLLAKIQELALSDSDIVAQTAPQCFDISVWQFMAALLTGGSVRIYPDETTLDPLRFADDLQRDEISIFEAVPSLLGAMLREVQQTNQLAGLRWLLVTGEALPPELARLALTYYPKVPLVNAYGPTECSDDVTHFVINIPPAESVTNVPIGRALVNTQLFILQRGGYPAPLGVSGELCVGGLGVGRGYANDPARTAAAFVPDPFATNPGRRLYRTGDRARYLVAGDILFLGRLDHQVKMRGFRIETGEIEAILAQHPAISEVAVVAQGIDGIAQSGDTRLVAYVVGAGNIEPSVSDLRAFLGSHIPEYMVPQVFINLDTLPLTASGKVDRQALPEPDSTRPDLEKRYVAPRTQLEQRIAGIWQEVLHIDRVGLYDNFFELGGHSLLATQVISRVRNTCHVDVPLRELFESPTVARLAELVETARSSRQPDAPPLLPVPRDRDLPLSYAQQRLWFIDQLVPGSDMYNMSGAVRLKGRLDPGVLSMTLNEVVRRHESLRTTFASVDGVPHQIIAPTLILTVPLVDLQALPESTRASEARRIAYLEGQKPFDLTKGPLLRAAFIKLSHEDHVGLFTMHHIVSDGWSMGVLMREMALLHEAFSQGQPSPLPELPIQYADFAHWQRNWLTGDVLKQQLSYWKDQLKGVPSLLELPTDRPRPPVQTHRGASQSLTLSEELSDKVRSLSRQQGVTLFMTLLAAFQTLLYRYTAQQDILVGSPIANRNRLETEGLIGFFVNTLVLRGNFSGDPSFRELLSRVRETTLGAYSHQDIPFEQIVEEVQPERNMSHSPLFQVMFNMEELEPPQLGFAGLTLESLSAPGLASKFDLTLYGMETDPSIGFTLAYNLNLFDASTIRKKLAHFQTLLEGIVSDPNQPIWSYPILSETERQQLLRWNAIEAPYPADQSVHALFESQVERTPESVALVFHEEQLSYAELNRRGNQLAHYFRSLGVGPEVKVGILMHRSPDMLVSILGVLKAGGTYVPLDLSYPKERLTFMIQDSALAVIVTHTAVLATLNGPQSSSGFLPTPESPHLTTILFDQQWPSIAQQSSANPSAAATAENSAYITYTSGSTGQPKGVLSCHRGVVNYLTYLSETYHLDTEDVTLQSASLSFDASVRDIMGPLVTGARLVLLPDAIALDSTALLEQVEEQRVTCLLSVVPTLLNLLNQTISEAASPYDSMRLVLVSGEALHLATVRSAKQLFSQASVVNQYGPTESTMTTSYFRLDASAGDGIAPLGAAIPNSRIYVLERGLDLTPIGTMRPLYVGGVGVTRGYLRHPALTAEKFLPDPYGQPGMRMYATGDLGRYLADGNLAFLGRADHQVKVRGIRIELGEIESVLIQHPAVQEAAVVARERKTQHPPNTQDLAAYIVSAREAVPRVSELRNFLGEKLPEFMVPSFFMMLDELPLTPNGKVDRRALPEPDTTRPEIRQAYLAARTPLEESLAGMWAEVLRVERVGIHDNFFELGGHSLLATQAISRVRNTFQVEVPLRELFESPTVARLAELVEKARSSQHPSAPPLVPVPRDQNLPVSFAQQRLWFIDQLVPGSAMYNIPGAVRVRGNLDPVLLNMSLNEVVRRHESLRTTFAAVDGEPLQVVAPTLTLSIPVVDLQELPQSTQESEARRTAYLEAQKPFDLTTGPLLRAALIKLGQEDHVGLFTMHHIVSDGWSMGVLIQEMGVLHEAFSQGKPSPLPELPIQYADFAHWQRSWLQGEVLEAQLAYWKEQLKGVPSLLELPTDRPRPAVQTHRGASQSLQLSEELSGAVRSLSQKEGTTLFMTLLAAFQTLLYRYTAQENILIGSPIANRNHFETEALIGFFVNTLVLKANFSGNPTFREFLARIRETTLGAYAHQDLPFERIVEEVQPDRNMGHTPLFQVMFVLQNIPQAPLRLPNLSLSPLSGEANIAKFDLTLTFTETDGALDCQCEHSTELFDDSTIETLLERLELVLQHVTVNPDSTLMEIPLGLAKPRPILPKEDDFDFDA